MLNPASETEAHSVQTDAMSFPRAVDEAQFGQQVFMESPRVFIDKGMSIVADPKDHVITEIRPKPALEKSSSRALGTPFEGGLETASSGFGFKPSGGLRVDPATEATVRLRCIHLPEQPVHAPKIDDHQGPGVVDEKR